MQALTTDCVSLKAEFPIGKIRLNLDSNTFHVLCDMARCVGHDCFRQKEW